MAVMRGNIADWDTMLRGDVQDLVAANFLAKCLDELYSSATTASIDNVHIGGEPSKSRTDTISKRISNGSEIRDTTGLRVHEAPQRWGTLQTGACASAHQEQIP
jgi:hypothetical protein